MSLVCAAVALAACGGGGDDAAMSEGMAADAGKRSALAAGSVSPKAPAATSTRPTSGVLFFATYGAKTDPLVLANPTITGGLYSIFWSEIETSRGQYDWSVLDEQIAEWRAVGKRVALRIVWSSSGYWRNPAAKTPTPQWVWDEGARFAYHEDSRTEVPLFWDPIYQKRAQEFLAAVAKRYDADPTVMFVDATPAAETNPYRFGTIDDNDPGFRDVFLATAASDGRRYSSTLWWETLQTYIGTVKSKFPTLPVLVTLNKAGMPEEPSRLSQVGDLATAKGLWVGQNGLRGSSFPSSRNAKNWLTWGATTQVFFETVSAAGGDTGTMQQLADACQRAACNWLNVYYQDVYKATPGTSTYDPAWEAALKDVASTVGK